MYPGSATEGIVFLSVLATHCTCSMCGYDSTLSSSVCYPQIQYVLTQKVFDPREVCEALHLCNRTSSHHHDDSWGSPLLQHIDKHFESLIRENERKRKFENKWYLPSSSQREAETRQYSAISSHHEQTRSGVKHDGSSNTITFLQLTDIHFDKKYSEVRPVTKWQRGEGEGSLGTKHDSCGAISFPPEPSCHAHDGVACSVVWWLHAHI